MDQKRQRKNDGTELVKEKNCSETSDAARKPSRPDALAEAERKPSSRQSKECGEEDCVEVSLRACKPHDESPLRVLLRRTDRRCLPQIGLLKIRHFFLLVPISF